MKWMKMNCTVYVSTPNDEKDPEDVASSFNRGFLSVVEDFPDANVDKAEVENIEVVSEEQARELGLVEDDEDAAEIGPRGDDDGPRGPRVSNSSEHV